MTGERIEMEVCRRTDRLDRAYLTSAMTEADYNKCLRDIDRWMEAEYRKIGVELT